MTLNEKFETLLHSLKENSVISEFLTDIDCTADIQKTDDSLFRNVLRETRHSVPIDDICNIQPYIKLDGVILLIWIWYNEELNCISEIEFYDPGEEITEKYDCLDLVLKHKIHFSVLDPKQYDNQLDNT